MGQNKLGGAPLWPDAGDPARSFGLRLAQCLLVALDLLKTGRPIAFTYHATSQRAWDALGIAIDESMLMITALWPIRNDANMGHHASDGNCEWDLVVVCRRRSECNPDTAHWSVDDWHKAVRPLEIGVADCKSMERAISMAIGRAGVPTGLSSP